MKTNCLKWCFFFSITKVGRFYFLQEEIQCFCFYQNVTKMARLLFFKLIFLLLDVFFSFK